MIITASAPSRISLVGGGTDLPQYADSFGGAVISFTINLYTHVTLRLGDDIGINDKHDLPFDVEEYLTNIVLKRYDLYGKAVVDSSFDGIIGAGLGSSSSYLVALLGAIHKAKDYAIDPFTLSEIAYAIETKEYNKIVGKQDGIACALGGFNFYQFHKEEVAVLSLAEDWIGLLTPYMLLFFLGDTRESTTIQEELREPTQQQTKVLHKIKSTVTSAIHLFTKRDIEEIGSLLRLAWEYKQQSNPKVSTKKVDEVYALALENGAFGGKLLGAGGGGHMFFLVPPLKRKRVIKAIRQYGRVIDFTPVYDGVITRIL